MAQKSIRREKGTGNIYQRSNGSWVGRLNIGIKPDGSPKIKCFSGKTESEVKRKIREYNVGGFGIESSKISLGTYLTNWLKIYKKDTLKPSSYDRLENTINHQIIPNIGMIQLNQLTSTDIQKLLSKLKTQGLSYSTVKKTHDCLHNALNHAVINGDIAKDPMLLVKMPEKKLFTQKPVRFFSKEEVSLILEECDRKYNTGAPVYIYGDAFVLMLNTGIRIGELIGLKKEDWNREEKTLSIKRNVQMVKERDADGDVTSRYIAISNSTKTYSGVRSIPLNERATQALENLCKQHPTKEPIVCTSLGTPVPPDRIERTFYRILKNVGISQTGTHTLRHTFASMLFSAGVDIKTVSQILGHASIQITLNTYIHLIDRADHTAVEKLDKLF